MHGLTTSCIWHAYHLLLTDLTNFKHYYVQSIITTGSERDRVHQKKKDKIQEKKTQFRESTHNSFLFQYEATESRSGFYLIGVLFVELKINQKILGSNRRVEKKSTKKRKKRTSQSLATMNKLAETLGDFAEYGNLALNVKPITSSKQRERVMCVDCFFLHNVLDREPECKCYHPCMNGAHCICRKEEGMRMKQVLEHPVFQQDPLQAVMTHLEATLPPAPVVKSGGGRARMSS